MSVEFGGGSTGDDDQLAEALRNAGHHVFAHLYEGYAARLFDYCVGILGDEVAAVIAVQDSLVAVDAQIGTLPDPDRLRVSLYSVARRHCLSTLSRRRVKPSGSSGRTARNELAAEQAGTAAAAATGRDTLPVAVAALAWLDDRDREVLNLAFRHGIEGADLAVVLGVSPRRARAILSDAGSRFQKLAAVAALRAGPAACDVLEIIAAKWDSVPPRLIRERRERLTRHVESCPRCAGQRGDQPFGPEMLAAVPLAAPPLTLRLRMTRTAVALGSYRRRGTGRTGEPGGSAIPARPRERRGVPRVMVVSSLGLAIGVVPGALVYRLVSASPASVAARMDSGAQGPASASTSLISSGLDPRGSVRQHKLPPLPGLLGPTPLGVLPVPSPHPGGPTPTPAPPHTTPPGPTPPTTPPPTTPPTTTPPTTPPPTTPPPTTPPPTTPPPTTPPPTPTPTTTASP
jgi:DNA-directed RNA polymerase specialized sigma24 family protein